MSTAQWYDLSKQLPLGVVYQNRSGEIIFANDAAKTILGLSDHQIQGKRSTDPEWRATYEDGSPFPGEDHPPMKVLATGKPVTDVVMGFYNPQLDQMRWLRVDSVPILEPQTQKVQQVMSLFSDITRLKEVEDELQGRREYFRATFNQAAIGIAHVATDGTWLRVNQKICDIVGYTHDELMSITFQDITHPDDLNIDVENVNRVLAGDIDSYTMEKRYIQKSGDIVWVDLTVSLVRDDNRTPKYFISIVQDIDDRKKTQQALIETEQQYEQTLDAINDLVLVKGPKSKILWANEAFRTYYGMSNEEMAGIIDAPFAEPEYTEQYMIDDEAVFQTGKALSTEEPVKRFDGEIRYFNTVKSPIFNIEEKVIKTVGVSRDITENKQNEQRMKQLNATLEKRSQELEAINQELDAFAYTVSHDLRAPLRAIVGFSTILNKQFADDLPPKAKQHLSRVTNGAQRMGQLIDDLLEFSRMGRQTVRKQVIQPSQIIEQILLDILPGFEDREINIRYGELPICHADSGLLRIVYLNLLNNALKFTQNQPISEVEIGSIQAESDATIYFVKDNGIGFEMQYIDKIFGVFQRLHKRDEYEGTGIGLATVQRIVHKHDGEIWAESEPNKGATFFFTVAE